MARGLRDLDFDIRLFGKHDRSGRWPGFALTGSGPLREPVRTAQFAANCLSACAWYRPDGVISAHLNFGPAAALAKRLFGTPYTLVAHGIDVHPGLPLNTMSALRGADRIIAVSMWTRDRVLALGGIDPRKVEVLHNTIDDSRFSVGPKPSYLVRRHGIAESERVILTVARLDAGERYKGCDRIIESMPAIIDACGPVRFIIVGSGGDGARLALLARECHVEKAVIFAGFVPAQELVDYYRLADVFAMPSTGEGFGIVFLEAMACGTPVLAGNRDGSVDAVDGGRLGVLVDPIDVGAVGRGISELLNRGGPPWWFDRDALSKVATERFGYAAFVNRLRVVLN